MESNRKRRGFTKGKQLVMSIYKGTSRSSSTKVKPSPSPVAAHHHVVGAGFINVNQLQDVTKVTKQQKVPPPPPPPHHVEFILNQEQVVPQSKQNVSFLLAADVGVGGGRQYDSYGILHDNNINKLYSVAVDESVDIKAATYISTVRERLRLHRVNPEHKKLQDMQQQ